MKLSRIGAAALCAALCLGTMSGCSSKTDGANEGEARLRRARQQRDRQQQAKRRPAARQEATRNLR